MARKAHEKSTAETKHQNPRVTQGRGVLEVYRNALQRSGAYLGEAKNQHNIDLLVRISCGHSWPLRQDAHLDARQITHLICVRLKHLLYDFLGGVLVRTSSTTTRDRCLCNFRAPSPLEALHWIFCFFSRICVQFSRTSPLKSGESSEKSSGENRVKSCHVCGCHGFFGPEFLKNH